MDSQINYKYIYYIYILTIYIYSQIYIASLIRAFLERIFNSMRYAGFNVNYEKDLNGYIEIIIKLRKCLNIELI